MTERETLLKQLDDQLESALIFLNQIEEAETLPQDVLHECKYDLLTLQNKLTHSLVQSLKISVDVIEVIGGPGMFTVGDAIDFASETLEYREKDDLG